MDLNVFYISSGSFGRRIQGIDHEGILPKIEIEKIEACYIESEKKVHEAIVGKYVALTPENIIFIEYSSRESIKITYIKRNIAIVRKEILNLNMNGVPLGWVTQSVILKCDGVEYIFYKPEEEYIDGNNNNFKNFVSKL